MSRTYNVRLIGFRVNHQAMTERQLNKEIEKKKDNERKMREARQHNKLSVLDD